MKIRVLKFGGTSIDRHEHRLLAGRKVVQAIEAGYRPVVVVSAIGRRGAPYATDTLADFLHSIDHTVQPHPREKDLMMACGEMISTVVMAQTLRILGHAAVALTGGQAGILTDQEFGAARILEIHPDDILKCLERDLIPVVAGFQGVTRSDGLYPRGSLTTLGRGGSDTTAAALGAALKADAVEIYTDVDGVKTADPDFVPNAPTLSTITYEEVAEIAHQGARVLHPRAAEVAMDYGIPLWVKNTFSDEPGTQVVPPNKVPNRRVTGVTHTGKLVYLSAHIPYAQHKAQLELEIYRLMSRARANIHVISLDEEGVGFACPREHLSSVRALLDGLLVPVKSPDEEPTLFYLFQVGDQASESCAVQRSMLERSGLGGDRVRLVPFSVVEGCTMVSVIAHGYSREPGVFATVLQTLAEEGIPVWQSADSELSLSCIIPESEVERAVRVLHDRFALYSAY